MAGDEQKRERLTRLAFNQATTDLILVCDERGLPVQFNRAYAEAIEAALGVEMRPGLQPHTLLEDPEERARWEGLHARVLAGETFSVEHSRGEVGGAVDSFELAYTPIVDEADEVIGFTEISRNTSKRKRAERALRASERRYREVTELTSDFAYAFARDVDGDGAGEWSCEWVTGALERMTGYTAEELGARGGWQALIHPEDLSVAQRQLDELVAGRKATVEYRLVGRSGEQRRVRDVARPERVNGETVRILGAVQDLTEIRAAEEETHRLEERVRRAQKLESLGLLSGGIAHDFNNLLMAIQGNAQLVAHELPEEAPERRFLARIDEACDRAASLCAQMLAYAGQGVRVEGPVNLSRVVREMGRMLEVAVSKKVALRYEVAARLPAIEADASQISQVVMNLITNASEAIGDARGTIEISTGLDDCRPSDLENPYIPETRPAGAYVLLRVRDTGGGMDDVTRARMFDPFFSSKFTGRGLGLAAVLGIVRAHRGAILVDSKPGRGTVVRIYFPAIDRAEVVPTPPPVEADDDAAWRGEGVVMVVDDERAVRRVAEQLLARMGFSVITADNGQQALDRFGERPDEIVAVLLDVAMPVVGGVQCCRDLLRIRADTPIIIATGFAEEEVIQRFEDLDVAGVLKKPYSAASLRHHLRRVLETRG